MTCVGEEVPCMGAAAPCGGPASSDSRACHSRASWSASIWQKEGCPPTGEEEAEGESCPCPCCCCCLQAVLGGGPTRDATVWPPLGGEPAAVAEVEAEGVLGGTEAERTAQGGAPEEGRAGRGTAAAESAETDADRCCCCCGGQQKGPLGGPERASGRTGKNSSTPPMAALAAVLVPLPPLYRVLPSPYKSPTPLLLFFRRPEPSSSNISPSVTMVTVDPEPTERRLLLASDRDTSSSARA